MSYRAHEAEFTAAVAALTGRPTSTYDKVDWGNPPTAFVCIAVTRRAVDQVFMDDTRRSLGWRVQIECFGSTHREVQWARERLLALSDTTRPAISASRLLPDGDADEPDWDTAILRWRATDSWIYNAPNPVRSTP